MKLKFNTDKKQIRESKNYVGIVIIFIAQIVIIF